MILKHADNMHVGLYCGFAVFFALLSLFLQFDIATQMEKDGIHADEVRNFHIISTMSGIILTIAMVIVCDRVPELAQYIVYVEPKS